MPFLKGRPKKANKAEMEQINEALARSKEHLEKEEYCEAYDVLREVQIPTANLPTPTKLDFYKTRFEALKNLKDTTIKHLAVAEAQEIVKYDPSYLPAHGYLFEHFNLIDKIPFRTLHHNYKKDAYDLPTLQRNICFNTIISLHQRDKSPCFRILDRACDMMYKSECLDLSLIKRGLEMMKFALQLDTEPLAMFAYSALLAVTPDFNKEPNAHTPFVFVATPEKAIESYVKPLANRETTPVDFCCDESFTQNNQIGFFQFVMGYLYETGTHVKQNLSEAKKWYKKSAHLHGNKFAAFHLGFLYYEGFKGVPQNMLLAKLYWQLAAAEGHPAAMVILGVLYLQQWEVAAGLRLIDACSELGDPSLTKFKAWFTSNLKMFGKQALAQDLMELDEELEEDEGRLGMSHKGLSLFQRVRRAELLGFDMNDAYPLGVRLYEIYRFQQCGYFHVPKEPSKNAVRYLFAKLYLLSPLRVYSIRSLRYQFVAQKKRRYRAEKGMPEIKYKTVKWENFEKEHYQCLIRKLSLEMCYDPMMPSCHHKNSSLNLTVVSEVYEEKINKTVTFVAEDHTGNVINVLLEDGVTMLRKDDEFKLESGIMFMVVHPFFNYGRFSHNYQRHLLFEKGATLSQIYLSGKVPDMCRFCGYHGAKMLCDKCGYKYCGQGCKTKDAKFLKHEYVCGNV